MRYTKMYKSGFIWLAVKRSDIKILHINYLKNAFFEMKFGLVFGVRHLFAGIKDSHQEQAN